MTYTELRDFLDRYTNSLGVIQGDPATIAGEAVAVKLVSSDKNYEWQFDIQPDNVIQVDFKKGERV